MSTNDDVQKRNAFAACAEFRIEGLEASLQHAREIAVREELGVVGHYIAEAQGYLAQIRLLHQEALDEFSRAQGELACWAVRRPMCLLFAALWIGFYVAHCDQGRHRFAHLTATGQTAPHLADTPECRDDFFRVRQAPMETKLAGWGTRIRT